MNWPEGLDFARRPRLRVIQAAEAAECGLACVAMVAGFHGHDIDLNSLRQRFSLSMSGASMKTLVRVAENLGLASRAVRVDLEALSRVRAPAILHWDMNHFVVLKRVGRKGIEIHDPARGRRVIGWSEASKCFTGVALELSPGQGFQRVSERATVRLRDLWSSISGGRRALIQVVALSAALQLVTFALPFQLQLVVDEALAKGDGRLLATIAVGFGGLILLQALIGFLRDWTTQVFTQLFSFQVMGNVVRHLLRLPSDFFEKRHVADILSRIQSASIAQEIVTRGVVTASLDGVMALGALAVLLVYSPLLTVVTVAVVGLNGLVAAVLYWPTQRRNEELIETTAREQSHLMESIRAATIVKLMGREAEREGGWKGLLAAETNAAVSLQKYTLSAQHLRILLTGLGGVGVVYLAATLVMKGGGFSVGMLFAFLSFSQTFSEKANSLVAQFVQFASIRLHLDRLADIVGAEPETFAVRGVRREMNGAISLSGVDFRYADGDPLTLEGVDLDIRAGEFLAITGRSGGGKTTLLKLLLGLRRPATGAILLDGFEANPELWREWREGVGVVSQDDRLMSGSIADNIAFFDPDMDMHRVVKAARLACIDAEIANMRMGYLSLIGDMGSALSGGQKQRILLARALYREPKVLVLDEGTANLDMATEESIAGLVAGLDITRIVVAHRPDLIARAHRVVEIAGGRLVRVAEAPLGSSRDRDLADLGDPVRVFHAKDVVAGA